MILIFSSVTLMFSKYSLCLVKYTMSQNGEEKNLWAKLEDLIDQICIFQTIPTDSYMAIYTWARFFLSLYVFLSFSLVHSDVYDYFPNPPLHTVASSKASKRGPFVNSGNKLSGRDLYNHIEFCLHHTLQSIFQVSPFIVLLRMIQVWSFSKMKLDQSTYQHKNLNKSYLYLTIF
jgi:hypothetical protein